MIFHKTSLSNAFLIAPEPRTDERGSFERYYCRKDFEKIGHQKDWVQLNHSITRSKGSIRGMHFQLPPFREIKLVKCVKGKVFDVIVDLRKDSPTFLHHFGAELSEQNHLMMYIPEGFAHGFQTLEEDCHLIYHHSEYFTPGAESGLRYNDPALEIQWPLPVSVISERDRQHTLIDDHFKGI
jgi:dTDP-4-dehydrorhamnose 3,5-epimerase